MQTGIYRSRWLDMLRQANLHPTHQLVAETISHRLANQRGVGKHQIDYSTLARWCGITQVEAFHVVHDLARQDFIRFAHDGFKLGAPRRESNGGFTNGHNINDDSAGLEVSVGGCSVA